MLTTTIMIGFAVFYAVEAVRKLPFIERRMHDGIRPWACNLCMTWWSALIYNALLALQKPPGCVLDLLCGPASAGVALVLLTWSGTRVPSPPPELPWS